MTKRVAIVYGGRDQRIGQYYQANWLRALLWQYAIDVVRHGDARGVDRDAGRIAKQAGYEVEAMPADWSQGRKGGVLRNEEMLRREPLPVLGVEFPGGRDTADMHRRLERSNVPILLWTDEANQ